MAQLEELWTRKCTTCKEIKPARTHHCSVCNKCVFLMDHHCPWINNCVGIDNQRYFLLFVFYLMVGTAYMTMTIMSIWHHHSYRQHKTMMTFLIVLDPILMVVMAGFTGWNWFLACVGNTTIEFWTQMSAKEEDGRARVAFDTVKDNLYRVFGTHKIFRILSPSMRNVPFTGLEWSFMFMDEGFDHAGYPIVPDEDPEAPDGDYEYYEEEPSSDTNHTQVVPDDEDKELELILIQ